MQKHQTGMGYLFDGFNLIATPGLKRYAFLPLLINICLFVILFFLMRHMVQDFNHWFEAYLPSWLQWLGGIIWLLFFASFFIFFIYTFVTLANLVAAPFNSLLAEKVETHLTGVIPAQQSMLANLKDVPRIMARQFNILGYYFPRACVILLLFFVPVLNTLAPVLWFLFNAWYITLTYVDYPADLRRISIQDTRLQLKQKRFLSLGFGVSVLLASMIPILNCFTIPAAVAGGTKLWINEFENR